MANPFKFPGLKKLPGLVQQKLSGSLPSDPKPGVIGPESVIDPEARKARFRRLAGIMGGFKK